MRTRAIATVLLAAGLLMVGCSSGGDGKASPPTTAPVTAEPTTPPTTTAAPKPAKAKPKPKATKDCGPGRDIYVWMRVPGVPDGAQELGDYSNCGQKPTFDTVRDTSPTVEGTCTEAAWVSDNPGYNPDAEPAERLKNVQVSIGPAC
jgi:hypothetical protein